MSETTKTIEERVQDHGDFLDGCCLEHQGEWCSDIVKRVLLWWDNCGEYRGDGYFCGGYAETTDRNGVVVFLTKEDKFAVLEDGEDYTGHG